MPTPSQDIFEIRDFRPEFGSLETYEVREVGHCASKILILENAIINARDFVQFISNCVAFGEPKTGVYPGLNAPISVLIAHAIVTFLRPLLSAVYGVGLHRSLDILGYYGLSTYGPQHLSPFQMIPHIDSADSSVFVVLIYLCEEKHGGTGFYRQRATGLEAITSQTLAHYTSQRNIDVSARSGRQARYMSYSDEHYEIIGSVHSRFARLVIYKSHLLHSAMVDADHISDDPTAGRLTLNIFIKSPIAGNKAQQEMSRVV